MCELRKYGVYKVMSINEFIRSTDFFSKDNQNYDEALDVSIADIRYCNLRNKSIIDADL